MKRLLEVRKNLKKKKPEFIRQDAHKKVRVGSGWRRSKGTDSKMRYGIKGYRRSVSVGWKSPSDVRGLSRTGLVIVHVSNLDDLKSIDSKKEGIIVKSGVGTKKRLEIFETALKEGISVINVDAKSYIEKKKSELTEKKAAKEKALKAKEEKDKKKKDAAKKKEEKDKKETPSVKDSDNSKEKEGKKSLDDLADDEDKKKVEKKEKDKLLIKKS